MYDSKKPSLTLLHKPDNGIIDIDFVTTLPHVIKLSIIIKRS